MVESPALRYSMREENFLIMDIEYIQISASHRCIRKLYMLGKDGCTEMMEEFYPCKRFNQLTEKYQSTFEWCRRNIHGLNYDPFRYCPNCNNVDEIVAHFISKNGFKFVTFKGGNIERELCKRIGVPSFDIECLVTKAKTHNPEKEVKYYYGQLLEAKYIIPSRVSTFNKNKKDFTNLLF